MRPFLCFGLMSALVGSCFGMGVGLTEDAARNDSDVIAHVLITATGPIQPAPETAPATPLQGIDRFQRLATARVLTPVKGCKAGDILSLPFDNGYGCPNISYSAKEECLVFLKKDPAGLYTTMNLYCGRFSVTNGQVQHFYLMGPREKTPASIPLKTAIDWLVAPPK